jgi:putative ABC transport system permease protein
MHTFIQDLLFGARMLRKSPSFTLIAVFTLALGIGVNTTIFGYANALLYRILVFQEPERVAYIWSSNRSSSHVQNPVSAPDFLDWRAQAQSFTGLVAAAGGTHALTGTGDPERISSARVTANFFQVFGLSPVAGRVFAPDEAKPGAARVVLLGYQFWQRRFAGDPNVLQQTITLDGRQYTVIGIMPGDFRYILEGDVWEPLVLDTANAEFADRNRRSLMVFGRLKPGVTVAQAQAEMENITRRSAEQFPATNAGWGAYVITTTDVLRGPKLVLSLLVGVVFAVLLIACANVANLQLARAAARQKEIAVRLALGAGRWRLVRQLLTENLLLAVMGGALGVLLAGWGKNLVNARFGAAIPLFHLAVLDWRVLGYTLLVALLSAFVFGLVPALQASKLDLTNALKEGGRNSASGAKRTRHALVVAEIALALALLVVAGLMIRTIIAYQRIEPGFDPNNLLALRLSLPEREYATEAQAADFYTRVLPNIAAQPGIKSVGAITQLPLMGDTRSARRQLNIEGRAVANDNAKPWAIQLIATPGYFECLGIPLQRGRQLSNADSANAPLAAVISQTMARKYWPDEDPLGQRLKFESATPSAERWITIVGIVGDVRNNSLGHAPLPHVYLPHAQHPVREMSLAVRTAGEPLGHIAAVRAGVQAVDRNLPVYSVFTMQHLFFLSLSETLVVVELLGAFAALALLLAAGGIYGVMSYAVAQRTNEIGIRMALGARSSDVLRLVIRQGMKLAALGVALGLALALGLTQLLKSILYGVSATDPLTFAGIALLLLGVAFVACWIPARRATRVDPLIALRTE